jgi:PPOX class probable F420-dependent enzyme
MATLDTSTDRGKHVERRLREDAIAWFTSVRPNGQPDSVPVWFLWDGESVLVYSRPDAPKLRNLEANPHVTLTIDDTRGGGDVIRIEGTARHVAGHAPAHEVPQSFASAYSAAVVVTPTRYRV